MSDFLKQMAQSSRDRVTAAPLTFTDDELDKPVHPLRLAGFDLIAEIKNRSPAEGDLSSRNESRTDRARKYDERPEAGNRSSRSWWALAICGLWFDGFPRQRRPVTHHSP